jgi:glyoxylase-like metal-dependent hydrolase (beta-lactamase superfamily II)
MQVQSFTVSPFAENCYVVHDGTEAALVDPGTVTPAERQAVLDYVEAAGLRVRHLLLTHAHIDHIFGCAFFAERFGADAEHGGWQLHRADLPLLEHAPVQAELFGVRISMPPAPTHFLEEGERIALGSSVFTVLHTPGHAPGHVVFYDEANGLVLGGDVLFQGSIGRTDLWEGDYDTLLASIRAKLLTLPDDTVVYPGHGPKTTIGRERRTNPFLTGALAG